MAETALDELRVVEVGDAVAVAYCGKLLAELGADVVKVEPPGGDPARRHGPFPGDVPHLEKSGRFLYLNTNKRSVTLDLDAAADRARLFAWLAEADVLVEGQPPAVAERRGLSYVSLRQQFPRLIVLSLTYFGQTGPYRDYHGTDLIASNLGGLADSAGEAEREPLRLPLEQTHYQAGANGAAAALTALFARDRTGWGQQIDLAIAEIAATCHQFGGAQVFVTTGRVRKRSGFRTFGFYPFCILPCQDGYVSMIAGRGYQWKRFLELIGGGEVPEWYVNEPRYQDRLELSWKYADEMDARLAPWLMAHTKEEIFRLCRERRIPFAPVYDIAEVVQHEHLRAREYFVTIDHPVAGPLEYPGAPAKLSVTPFRYERGAPRLSEELRDGGTAGTGNGAMWRQRGGATTAEPSVPQTQSRVPTGCLSPHHSALLPLAGIRIVDFGWVLAGPIVGKLLADMGAEVIKVESRLRLDEMRQSPSNPERDPERDPVFHGLNRNKLSVTVDFTRPEGQELIRRLVAISDAVSENFSPSVLRRYGLDYEALRQVRPDLVMLSLSSAGQYGPLWDVQTYGPTLGPIAGIDGLVGYHGGRVLGSQGFYSDPTAGIHGAVALLAALRYRARTGIGQYVDLAQWEANVGVIGEAIMDYTMNGRVAKPQGNRDPDMAPHQNYRCANEGGWIGICCRDDRDWQVLRQVMGDPEWARDSRFDCLAGRQAHLEELDARISEWTATQETYDLMHRLQAAGVPAAPSLDAGGRFFNEHFVARELLQEIDHPVTGTEVVTAPAWRFSDTPGALFRPAPQLGEHNDYVFGELLGLSADEIVRLAEERVLH